MSAVRVEISDAIARVTISNPGKLNALNAAMWRELAQAFFRLNRDNTLRCVLVRGDGEDFAAGADIEEFPALRGTLEQGMHYHTQIVAPALGVIANCAHPTVTAIEGACVGGGLEIACACDLRVAAFACLSSDDYRKGVEAFLGKRPPRFTGH